jgi:hypothetical protein
MAEGVAESMIERFALPRSERIEPVSVVPMASALVPSARPINLMSMSEPSGAAAMPKVKGTSSNNIAYNSIDRARADRPTLFDRKVESQDGERIEQEAAPRERIVDVSPLLGTFVYLRRSRSLGHHERESAEPGPYCSFSGRECD